MDACIQLHGLLLFDTRVERPAMDARIQLQGLGLRFAPVGATECPPDIQRPAKHEQVAIFRQKNERIANVFRIS